VDLTGCDSLAVAIGTSHGVYPPGLAPRLHLDLLRQIGSAVPVPLVLHGGSGNADSEVAEACRSGIAKVNIASDIKAAYYGTMRELLVRDPGLIHAEQIEPACEAALAQVVHAKNRLLGACGGADAILGLA